MLVFYNAEIILWLWLLRMMVGMKMLAIWLYLMLLNTFSIVLMWVAMVGSPVVLMLIMFELFVFIIANVFWNCYCNCK